MAESEMRLSCNDWFVGPLLRESYGTPGTGRIRLLRLRFLWLLLLLLLLWVLLLLAVAVLPRALPLRHTISHHIGLNCFQ